MKGIVKTLFLLTLLLAAAGCTTANLVSSWASPQVPDQALKKVLVVSMMGGKYIGTQQHAELQTVNRLKAVGISAESSIEVFGPEAFKSKNDEAIDNELGEKGFTSILILSLLDKKKEVSGVPSGAYYNPAFGWPSYYWSYASFYGRIYSPGYYSTSTSYMLNAEIYALSPDKLIYSGQASSVSPDNIESMMDKFSQVIVGDMKAKGLVK